MGEHYMETECSYIQATPGFHIAHHNRDMEDPEFKLKANLTPIIVWKIKGGWKEVSPLFPFACLDRMKRIQSCIQMGGLDG